jgi:hypothetical protein
MANTNTSSQAPKEPKENAGHWWEVYFIRYFVGTVVGAAILLYLNKSEHSALKEFIMPGVVDVSKLEPQLLVLLGTVGLTYCYVASAPVLVLHAARASLLPGLSKILNPWLIGATALALVIAVVCAALTDARVTILSLTALFLVLALQLIPLFLVTRTQGEAGHKYYMKIAEARADTKPYRQEYKESYRHLREHGNAFLILLFEAVLGVILAGSTSSAMALIILIVWVLPAAFIWVYGCILEYRYAQ